MDLSQTPHEGDADPREPDQADLPPAPPALHPWRWRVVLGVWIIVVIGLVWWLDPEPTSRAALSQNDVDHLADGFNTPSSPPAANQIPIPSDDDSWWSLPPQILGLPLAQKAIEYCLAEDIRVDTIKRLIDHTRESQIAEYNARAADYNSRCGDYNFREDDMYAARRDIDMRRDAIIRQATRDHMKAVRDSNTRSDR